MNKAQAKQHALECSRVCKGGRFTRVGEDFYSEVEADFEALLRSILAKNPTQWPTEVELPEGTNLLDLTDRTKIHEIFTRALARIIQRRVERQPSCGCTLGRTQ